MSHSYGVAIPTTKRVTVTPATANRFAPSSTRSLGALAGASDDDAAAAAAMAEQAAAEAAAARQQAMLLRGTVRAALMLQKHARGSAARRSAEVRDLERERLRARDAEVRIMSCLAASPPRGSVMSCHVMSCHVMSWERAPPRAPRDSTP